MHDPAAVNSLPTYQGNVTNLLLEWGNGDWSALERLTPIIYHELLRLARARLSRENRDCTLQPTALVHECYLRLADQTRLQWQNRAHFYAVAANTMRRVLIDQARKRKSLKRGQGVRVTLKTGSKILLMPESVQVRLGSQASGVYGSFAKFAVALTSRTPPGLVPHSERPCAR